MDIKIGKFTLETLTTGMYDSPKDIYREYIQNAVDSIDSAVLQGLIKKQQGQVEIYIGKEQKNIIITDNGTGVSSKNAQDFLLSVGNSTKISSENRGFRGIGRLAGLAYCDELVFETSFFGEETKTIIKFDAKELKHNLYLISNSDNLEEILKSVICVKSVKESRTKHYFKVSMYGVDNVDNILEIKNVNEYLSQVIPVPFSPTFKWGSFIESKLKQQGLEVSRYKVLIKTDEEQFTIYKNYKDEFTSDRIRKISNSINDIETKVFIDEKGIPMAFLWWAETDFSGTIQDITTKGIRLRKGNIQLGSYNTLNSLFKDERFNGWLIGEVHIVSPSLIPNARRDNVEKNESYYLLASQFKEWASDISTRIRKISVVRNTEKVNKNIENLISEGSTDIDKTKADLLPEIVLFDKNEYDDVAHSELLRQLDVLIDSKHECTKYKALNLQTELTVEQKKILEGVFDIIKDAGKVDADTLISMIIKGIKN